MPKYNLLSLCNVTCTYVFRVDNLVSNNQLLPWGRLFLPPSAFLTSLCRVESSWPFLSPSVCPLGSSSFSSYWGVMSVRLYMLIFLGNTVSKQTPNPTVVTTFLPLFVDVSVGTGLRNSAFSLVMVKTTLICGYKDRCLECCYRLC